MSRDQWKQFNQADTNHRLSDFAAVEGESLRVLDSSTKSIEALEKSLTDKPAEGKIESQVRGGSVCFYFRVQDNLNYYIARFNINTGEINVDSVNDGLMERVPATKDPGLDIDDEKYHPHRVKFWVDSGGDLRIQWFLKYTLDSESEPEWRQIGTDIVDTSPSFSAGGGIGIGGFHECESDMVWYDETKIYYPD